MYDDNFTYDYDGESVEPEQVATDPYESELLKSTVVEPCLRKESFPSPVISPSIKGLNKSSLTLKRVVGSQESTISTTSTKTKKRTIFQGPEPKALDWKSNLE